MAIFTPMLERGEVRLPRSAPWLDPFLEECGQFPNGKFDDQVDALSQALFAIKIRRPEIRHASRYEK